jgi:hypothetical protein
MALWRCPNCGTPQPVTARCWVCRRSSTSCATCQHFRTSVAARIGYCGLDRAREPLSGGEVRSCWVGRPLVHDDDATPARPAEPPVPVSPPTEPYLSGFVPLDPPVSPKREAPAPPPPEVAASLPAPSPASDGLLWADLEA